MENEEPKAIYLDGYISDQMEREGMPDYRYPEDGGLPKLTRIHHLRPSLLVAVKEESKEVIKLD